MIASRLSPILKLRYRGRLLNTFAQKEAEEPKPNQESDALKELRKNFNLEDILNQPIKKFPKRRADFAKNDYLEIFSLEETPTTKLNKLRRDIALVGIPALYSFYNLMNLQSFEITPLALNIFLAGFCWKLSQIFISSDEKVVRKTFIAKNVDYIILGFVKSSQMPKIFDKSEEVLEELKKKSIDGNIDSNLVYCKFKKEQIIFFGWDYVLTKISQGKSYSESVEMFNNKFKLKDEKEQVVEIIDDLLDAYRAGEPPSAWLIEDLETHTKYKFLQKNNLNSREDYFDYIESLSDGKNIKLD